jgi:hypothetical protein
MRIKPATFANQWIRIQGMPSARTMMNVMGIHQKFVLKANVYSMAVTGTMTAQATWPVFRSARTGRRTAGGFALTNVCLRMWRERRLQKIVTSL